MPVKLANAEKPVNEKGIKLREALPVPRTGGENRPFEYPHLYRIQAGDWRISYAVEHNRLAILVLEVLGPDGAARKDEKADTVKRTMKIKLLDWPEGSPSRDLPPEELGRKIKIKFMDLADEIKPEGSEAARPSGAIKLGPESTGKDDTHRITFVDATARPAAQKPEETKGSESKTSADGKVTPLDGPTM